MSCGEVIQCCKQITAGGYEAKDFFPFISSFIVVLLFIIDRFIAANIRKKELSRNWYYKVHLEPNLKRVNIFFSKVDQMFQESTAELGALSDSEVGVFTTTLRAKIKSFKELKRKFELQVITPILSRHPVEGEILSKKLRDVDDLFVNAIDSLSYDEDSIEEFTTSIYSLKASFLKDMQIPLK